MPFTTYFACIEVFTKNKDLDRTNNVFLKAEKDLLTMENDSSQISNVNKMMYYLPVSGNMKRTWEYFAQYADWNRESDDFSCYLFAKNVLHLLCGGGRRALRINAIMPWYRADNTYNVNELYDYYYKMAK
ncbi:MAG: hypothetical protein LBL90_07105 [Prevotellaceae bacterium]|jgi:hypothetical protein|nr:hypothetical protein [Prevotellaceae bacterium]